MSPSFFLVSTTVPRYSLSISHPDNCTHLFNCLAAYNFINKKICPFSNTYITETHCTSPEWLNLTAAVGVVVVVVSPSLPLLIRHKLDHAEICLKPSSGLLLNLK